MKAAPPGMPVEVLGFDSVPQAGDVMYVMPNEETAKDITEKVKEQKKLENTASVTKSSLEEMMAIISSNEDLVTDAVFSNFFCSLTFSVMSFAVSSLGITYMTSPA